MRARSRDYAAVGLLAFVVRIAHAAFVSSTPFFRGPVIDAHVYRVLAARVAAGGGFGGAFYQPPLYPAIVAGLIRVGLGSPWAVAIVQALAGAATCALLVAVGRAVAESSGPEAARRAGLATGLMAALYGPLVLFDIEALPPAFVHLPLVAALVLVLGARRRAGVPDAIAGLLVGIATIGWVPAVVFAPGLLGLRARRARSRASLAAAAALLALGLAVPVAVVAAHNAAAGSPGVLVSSNAGLNLWLGNNPRWRATWRARPGAAFEPLVEQPDREGVTQPGARSRYFERRVLRDVAARPGAALVRTAEKLYYAWHGREIRRNQDLETLRAASPILRALEWEHGLMFPFGLLAPLALLAAFRRRREPVARWLFVTAVAYSLVLAVFFVAARYRLPLVLLLLPLAGDRVAAFVHERRMPWREAIALLALLVVLNGPNAFTARFGGDPIDDGLLRARAYENEGERGAAERLAASLVMRAPSDADVHMLRAQLLVHDGRCAEAIPDLRRTASLAPRTTTPLVMLGQCLTDAGDFDGAEHAYARALALHPYHPEALKGAAVLYMRFHQSESAIALLERFRHDGYRDPNVDFDLGRLLLDTGHPRHALRVLEPLLRTQPHDRELRALVTQARHAAARR